MSRLSSLQHFYFFFNFAVAGQFLLPANAETLLTNGTESTRGLDSHKKGHGVWQKWIAVDGFNHMDQCAWQPGQSRIMSFSIILQMTMNEFNKGNGLVLCYLGQLDEANQANGVTTGVRQHANNKMGNPLNETCEKARMKMRTKCGHKNDLMAECLAFTEYPWHGIKFGMDKNEHDLQMTMSTTERSFLIPRDAFENGRLVYKLTIWDNYRASFSKIIGPGKEDFYYNEKEEKRNRVIVEESSLIQDAFGHNARAGAFLNKHFGPWALAPDLLPRFDETSINIYVIRSECSELAATFLLPTDSASSLLPVPSHKRSKKRLPFAVDSRIQMNSFTTFRGKIHQNAKKFFIQLTFFERRNGLKGVKFFVKFEQNSTLKISTKFEERDYETQNKQQPRNPIKLTKGRHFHLKISPGKEYINVSLNCAKWVKYDLNVDITMMNDVRIMVTGDMDLYKVDYTRAPKRPLKSGGGQHNHTFHTYINIVDVDLVPTIEHKCGYLIRGHLLPEWEKISVEFYSNHTSTIGKMPVVMKFWADNFSNQMYFFSYYDGTVLDQIEPTEFNQSPMASFELQFHLNLTHCSVLLGEKLMGEIELAKRTEIKAIKIQGDIVVEQQEATYATPAQLKYPADLLQPLVPIKLRGKVKEKAHKFTIALVNDQVSHNAEDASTCMNTTVPDNCAVALYIRTDFGQKKTTIGSIELTLNDDKKTFEKIPSQVYGFDVPFVPGADFECVVTIMDPRSFNVTCGKLTGGGGKAEPPQKDFINALIPVTDITTNVLRIVGDVLMFENAQMRQQFKDLGSSAESPPLGFYDGAEGTD